MSAPKRMPRDGYPEHQTFVDDGCEFSPSCLTCPIPACRYDLPPGQARALMQRVALVKLLKSGSTMDEAAVVLGVSQRTVYRLRRMVVEVAA